MNAIAYAPTEREIRAILDDLYRERRRIAFKGSDESLRHANQLGIAYWQLRLLRLQKRTPAA